MIISYKNLNYKKWLEALEAHGEEFSQKVKQIEMENRSEKIRI